MSNGGPHDHPGSYRLISVNATVIALTPLFEQAEADGYKFVAMNDSIAVFYKDND